MEGQKMAKNAQYTLNGSPLDRQSWIRMSMASAASKSVLTRFTGTTPRSMIMTHYKPNVQDGNQVIFQMRGVPNGAPIAGTGDLGDVGELPRYFNDKLVMNMYGKVFTALSVYADRNVGERNTEQMLMADGADWYARHKEQMIWDALQGNLADFSTSAEGSGDGTAATNGATRVKTFAYNGGNAQFSLDEINELSRIANNPTGLDYDVTNGAGSPLAPFAIKMGPDGAQVLRRVAFIGPETLKILRNSNDFKEFIGAADVRGDASRVIMGVLADFDDILFVRVPRAYSALKGTPIDSDNNTKNSVWTPDKVEIDMQAGVRSYDANGRWSGDSRYSNSGAQYERNVLCGAGALQYAMALNPTFVKGDKTNFDRQFSYGLNYIGNVQKCKWDPEKRGDYKLGKIGNLDYGVIAFDVQFSS